MLLDPGDPGLVSDNDISKQEQRTAQVSLLPSYATSSAQVTPDEHPRDESSAPLATVMTITLTSHHKDLDTPKCSHQPSYATSTAQVALDELLS